MSDGRLILYDIPSKDQGCTTWSYNVWRTRLALNYKGIDYETVWVEYPDIEPLMKSFGLSPNKDPETPWTLPAVRFPDGTYVMNSKLIAPELEKRYPAPEFPSLRLDSKIAGRSLGLVVPIFDPIVGVLIPRVPRLLLNDRSAEFFYRTRKEDLSMTLDEFEEKHGGEQAWEKSQPGWEKLAEALREEPGPFLLGDTVTYEDFLPVGILYFIKRLIGDEEYEQRTQKWPEIEHFYSAYSKWLKRNSY
ncbi:glutathione s-transferase [Paramyrothecium foliicola]|nr:glutathione s-transferase [Paramyrothecium foliicola]